MNRRKFLGLLGGAATVAALPSTAVGLFSETKPSRIAAVVPTIGQYADYFSFSDLAFQAAICENMSNISKEMACRLGSSVDMLII